MLCVEQKACVRNRGIGKSIHDCCFRGVYSFSRVLKAMYFRGGIKLQVWIFAKMRLRSIGSE